MEAWFCGEEKPGVYHQAFFIFKIIKLD